MIISEFFNIVKESNFNILDIYSKAPNETLISLAIVLLIILVIYFLINRNIKISNSLKLVEKIQNSKSFDDLDKKFSKLIEELPKRGEKLALSLNATKEHTLFRTCKLISNFSINDKIEKYQDLSKKYSQVASNVKKYNNSELTKFYEEKSKELLEKNLFEEIAYYYENVHFCEEEVINVNAIVKYANSLERPNTIIDPMINVMNKFSFGYNSDLFRFIEKLTKEDSKQIFEYTRKKIDELFENGENEVSINILNYLIEENQKQRVYKYISNLKLASYLQQLHDLYFNKKDDINLDLAFIANLTKINSDYKKYLDDSLTSNWRNSSHIEFISKSTGVLDVLGHMEFRTLIERIDNIRIESENKKMIEEALAIAKRAEVIALEAKSLNKRPIIMSTPNKN